MKAISLVVALSVCIPALASADEFANDQICKAAISMEMFRPPAIMKTEQRGEVPQISYTRDDGDSFLYKCKLSGDRVVWSAYFPETSSWGRWRDGEWDAVLTYSLSKGSLSISSSETGLTKTFRQEDF